MDLYDRCFEMTKRISPELPIEFTADIAGAKSEFLSVGYEPFELTVYECDADDFEYKLSIPPFVYAPVRAGEKVGELLICRNDRELRRVPLYAAEDAEYYNSSRK